MVRGEGVVRFRQQGAVRVVAAVERVPEQVALPRLVGVRCCVDEVEDVAEPVALGGGVVLEERLAVVQPLDGVGDAALHRLRELPAVLAGPVAEHLPRLVGTLEDGGDDAAVPAFSERAVRGCGRVPGGFQSCVRELGGADEGRGRMLPSPRSQPSRPAVHSGSSTASLRTSCV
jgi:hypothetical protein